MKIRHIILALFLLPFLEFWFFGVVSTKIGILPSLALMVGLCFSGFALLKSEGKRLLQALKNGETVHFSGEAARDGLMTGIGGLLLALPGFLSDIAALFFLVPYFRSFLAGERSLAPTASSPKVIDLPPEQWVETKEIPTRKKPPQN